jgi:hypothetical protein
MPGLGFGERTAGELIFGWSWPILGGLKLFWGGGGVRSSSARGGGSWAWIRNPSRRNFIWVNTWRGGSLLGSEVLFGVGGTWFEGVGVPDKLQAGEWVGCTHLSTSPSPCFSAFLSLLPTPSTLTFPSHKTPRWAGYWLCLFTLGCGWGMKRRTRDLVVDLIAFGLTRL